MHTMMIAVCGGSGSGKSTLVQRLKTQVDSPELQVLAMDHYYRDLTHLSQPERDQKNFDHPEALDLELLIADLKALKAGQSIERPNYDFASHTRLARRTRLVATRVIIVDGILALHSQELRTLFDLSLYVDVDDDLRFIRRLRRDISERGRTVDSVINQYLGSVKLMHDTYVEPQKYRADIIISWRDYNDQAIQMLRNMLSSVLGLAVASEQP